MNEGDDILVEYLESKDICFFRGVEHDLLSRFYHCATEYNADIIVRVTADDPFKSPEIIDLAINKLLSDNTIDYCSNTLLPTYPEGLDIEVFTYSALEIAYHTANSPADREHVTSFIWNNTTKFHCFNFNYKENLSRWRWTVDKDKDLEFVRAVVKRLDLDFDFNYEEVIGCLKNNDDLIEINANRTVRNEGYLKSIANLNPLERV